MDKQETIASIEQRAIAVRKNMTDVCRAAGVDYATWYRAKNDGSRKYGVSLETIDKLETALTAIEKERATASA